MREPDARDSARVLAIALVPIAAAMGLAYARLNPLANVLVQLSFLLIPLFYAHLAGVGARAGNGLRPLSLRQAGFVLLASLGTFWLLNGLTHLQDLAVRAMGLQQEAEAQAEQIRQGIEDAQKVGVVPTTLLFIIIPPLCEEVFFRGILFRGLVKRFGIAVALAGTTVLFSAFHQMNVQKVLMLFVGGYFGTLVYLTGSLWASILAHAVNNFAVLLLMWIYKGRLPDFVAPWWMYVLSAMIFGLAITLLWLERKSARE
jgi:membrane protease YdiL (CAAX protease family)